MNSSCWCTTRPQLHKCMAVPFWCLIVDTQCHATSSYGAQSSRAGLYEAESTYLASPQWLHLGPCNPGDDHLCGLSSVLQHQCTAVAALQQCTHCAQESGTAIMPPNAGESTLTSLPQASSHLQGPLRTPQYHPYCQRQHTSHHES